MMHLTIIIPHYNSVESLEKLLNSIPTSEGIEIIVIDDKSTQGLDKWNELLIDFRNGQTIFMRNETNKKGAGVCRNIGLEKARGEWILFADSDDYFVSSFYEKIKPFLNSDYDVIFFRPDSIDIETGKSSDRHLFYENLVVNYLYNPDIKTEAPLRYFYSVPWSKLIKRSFLQSNRINFDEVMASNDVMFSTKVGYYMNHFYVSNDVIYCVTKSNDSLTAKKSEKMFNTRLGVFINHCRFLQDNLTKKELEVLNINGRMMIILAWKYNLGIHKAFSVYRQLRNNHIKVFEWRLMNPILIFLRSYSFIQAFVKKSLN
ncbi:glycosyltransferase family 2 protein [Oceanobacillus halophilus]|nr:glycosyltransferase family 2 protein [Oceanobacillus halophilus]